MPGMLFGRRDVLNERRAGEPDRRHFIVMLLDYAQAWKCQQISDKQLGSCEHASHKEGRKELAGDFLGRPAKPELYLCHR